VSDLARISDQPSVRVNRLLPARIDEVYAAWTDPAFMCRWFSPTGRAEVAVDRLTPGTAESHQGGWTSIVAHLVAALGGLTSPHQEELTPKWLLT
jgi:uncharacterized protein YndB with AHSA1/START domain